MAEYAGAYVMTRQGQITVPAQVRKLLGLKKGDELEFYYEDDLLLVKKKREPIEVFEELASKTRKRFKERGITKTVVEAEIESYRKKRRAEKQ